ncbi:MAG: MFS transporter [Kofleriaceae bacterium]
MFARLSSVRRSLPDAFWLVWLGTLVNRAGGFVMPLLGYYLTDARGLTRGTAVAVATCYGVGLLASGLVGGVLADRLGRRRTMLASLFGGAAMLVALSEARGVYPIGAAALALGFLGELYRPAVMAYVTDVVPAPDRARAFAYQYWAINLGFTIAPVVGGALADWSYRAVFLGDAATMAAYGVLVAARVPESRPAPAALDAGPPSTLRTVLTDRVFLTFVGLCLVVGLMFFQTTMTLSLHLEHLGLSASTYGLVIGVNGGLIVLAQPWLAARVTSLDGTRVLAVSAVLAGLGLALHGLPGGVAIHVGAVAVWTVGEIIQSPFFSSTVAALAPADARGRYQGVFGMSFGAAAMLAPLAGQALVAAFGPRGPWLVCGGLGLVVAAGFIVTGPARRARGA